MLDVATFSKVVLIIENDGWLREALAEILLIAGLKVLTATNGHEGLTIYQEQRPSIDLIILDMNMPVMNGDETFRRLRRLDPQLRVLISSSCDKAEVDRRLDNPHSISFLHKPYRLTTLLDQVQTILLI
jgi:DNA-binding response OmpR family regulator